MFSRNIDIEFGLDKCVVLVLKHGVRLRCEGIVLPDGHVMSQMDESRYKCLGIFEGADVM